MKIKQIFINYNSTQDNILIIGFYRNPVYEMSTSKVYCETTFFEHFINWFIN